MRVLSFLLVRLWLQLIREAMSEILSECTLRTQWYLRTFPLEIPGGAVMHLGGITITRVMLGYLFKDYERELLGKWEFGLWVGCQTPTICFRIIRVHSRGTNDNHHKIPRATTHLLRLIRRHYLPYVSQGGESGELRYLSLFCYREIKFYNEGSLDISIWIN